MPSPKMKTIAIDFEELRIGAVDIEVPEGTDDADAIEEFVTNPDYNQDRAFSVDESVGHAWVDHDASPVVHEARLMARRVARARVQLLSYVQRHETPLADAGVTVRYLDGDGRPCSASAAVGVRLTERDGHDLVDVID